MIRSLKTEQETKNAIIIEDDLVYVRSFSKVLEKLGWIVVGTAESVEQTVELLSKLKNIQIDIDLALIDGFLKIDYPPPSKRKYRYIGQGGTASRIIKEKLPAIVTIGISRDADLQEEDPHIDHVTAKDRAMLETILEEYLD